MTDGQMRVGYGPLAAAASRRASRIGWDAYADDYQAEHGAFLGDAGFVWCPEGLDEATEQLLGDSAGLAGRVVLEVGCGAGQCSRWLRARGVRAVGLDLSAGMLGHSVRLDRATGVAVPVLQGDAGALPVATDSVDHAFSAFGALPFVADAGTVLAEVARVLRPGGGFVAAVNHPLRWVFPDDPGSAGLTVTRSYFDRSAYVEYDDTGDPVYVEHHRTVGDWVRALRGAGLVLDDLVEPEWPPGHERPWGQWSPLRGALMPGTLILVAHLPLGSNLR